ncbi:MAG: ABC transporter permease [bacterium]|nr:ABC transporter permease [bacterium]
MRHWLQLATRNWRAKPGRAIASTAAIALGVGTVVSITCFYESVRRAVTEQVVDNWLGNSHLTIDPPLGHWGFVDQALAGKLAEIDNVARATYRLKRAVTATITWDEHRRKYASVDAIGLEPTQEYAFRLYRGVVGRLIEPGERGMAVIETASAEEWGVVVGDTIGLSVSERSEAGTFRIVGTYDVRRVAEFQRPTVLVPLIDLQEIKQEANQVTSIDLMLEDASIEGLHRTGKRVRAVVDDWSAAKGVNLQVTTAETKLEQLREAEQATQLVLMLVAFIALLTSFFIILSTMSMGIVERIAVLGMMRCVGVTRAQLATLVLAEVLPMGLIGVLAGLPVGLAMTWIGASFVPEYVEGVTISTWGMVLAVVGGLSTILAAAAFLVVQVARVSPLEATHPEAKPTRLRLAVALAAVGGVCLAAHQWMIVSLDASLWFQPAIAFLGTATLYVGYVVIAPLVVMVVGVAVVHLAAWVLGVRRKLARDQIGRSPWRSAAVCWMLMVGLSLIVYIDVRSESIIAAWDFPSKLPSTFVWSPERVPTDVVEEVRRVPGVTDVTMIGEIPCQTGPPGKEATSFFQGLKEKFKQPVPATFVAGELDTFLAMSKLGFLQGDLESAIAKLARGGYVLLPPESANTYGLGVGDKITLSVGRRSAEFEVAGVVESPALDIAVTFFQADSYMMLAAAGSFLGTLEDAERCFGYDSVTMFMMNVDLPPSRHPDTFEEGEPPELDDRTLAASLLAWRDRLPNERGTLPALVPKLQDFLDDRDAVPDRELGRVLTRTRWALRDTTRQWEDLDARQRWELFRERLVLRRVCQIMDRSHFEVGSLRTLKEKIDAEIRDATQLMTAIPTVALVVAALGVANLMMVNVTARSRQIAVVRAVGATKWQIVRLVLAEALALGLLGSIIGVALGLHSANSGTTLTASLFGIESGMAVPWGRVAAAVVLTVVICLAAGIAPARHAARNNIVEAIASL